MLYALLLFAQVVSQSFYVQWNQDASVIADNKIEVYLVCFDGQPTSACARVPATSGVGTTNKVFEHPIPPLVGVSHVVVVQACTANASECSAGAILKFSMGIIPNPNSVAIIKK